VHDARSEKVRKTEESLTSRRRRETGVCCLRERNYGSNDRLGLLQLLTYISELMEYPYAENLTRPRSNHQNNYVEVRIPQFPDYIIG